MQKKLVQTSNPNAYFTTICKSHKGYVRAENEDRLAVREFVTSDAEKIPVLLAVLSDGVGGHRAGEIAAQIGVTTVVDTITACTNLSQPERLLAQAIRAANQQVLAHAAAHAETRGMGATCVCVFLIGNQFFLANLGDSRAYILRKKRLIQTSFDHTWLRDASERIAPEMKAVGRDHPMAHILTRYLGSTRSVEVDLRVQLGSGQSEADMLENQGVHLESGERVLLCSDGLTDMLDEITIGKLAVFDPLENASESLLRAALAAGGHDNTSLILIQLP